MPITHGLYIEKKKGHIFIRLPNVVKKDNITHIENRIESSLKNYKGNVIVDLSDTLSIFSILVTLLMHIDKKVTEAGGSVKLINVSKKCQAQLKSMNLDRVLTIDKKEAGSRKKAQ
jgi:anti-anti-sigma regulatory factor